MDRVVRNGRHRHQERDVAAALGAHHPVHSLSDRSSAVGASGVQVEAGFIYVDAPAAMTMLHHPLGEAEKEYKLGKNGI